MAGYAWSFLWNWMFVETVQRYSIHLMYRVSKLRSPRPMNVCLCLNVKLINKIEAHFAWNLKKKWRNRTDYVIFHLFTAWHETNIIIKCSFMVHFTHHDPLRKAPFCYEVHWIYIQLHLFGFIFSFAIPFNCNKNKCCILRRISLHSKWARINYSKLCKWFKLP